MAWQECKRSDLKCNNCGHKWPILNRKAYHTKMYHQFVKVRGYVVACPMCKQAGGVEVVKVEMV